MLGADEIGSETQPGWGRAGFSAPLAFIALQDKIPSLRGSPAPIFLCHFSGSLWDLGWVAHLCLWGKQSCGREDKEDSLYITRKRFNLNIREND